MADTTSPGAYHWVMTVPSLLSLALSATMAARPLRQFLLPVTFPTHTGSLNRGLEILAASLWCIFAGSSLKSRAPLGCPDFMTATIIPIKRPITNCSRCKTWITDGQSTVTITVAKETWYGLHGEIAEVEVDDAKAALVFCHRCASLYDFTRIAVGRSHTEEDEVVIALAEEAEIEVNREAAAKEMQVSPDRLSAEQVRGWILEQQYKELEAEGFFDHVTS